MADLRGVTKELDRDENADDTFDGPLALPKAQESELLMSQKGVDPMLHDFFNFKSTRNNCHPQKTMLLNTTKHDSNALIMPQLKNSKIY